MVKQTANRWLRELVLVALGGLLATAATAIINAQGGDVLTACVNNKNGNARIVGSEAECRNPEYAVQWNVVGPAGPQGPPGPGGPQGQPGISGREIVNFSQARTANGAEVVSLAVSCPSNKKVLGGGGMTGNGFLTLTDSAPIGENSWQIAYKNITNAPVTSTPTVFAICALVAQ